ncbi:MAG: prolipoprotein diacylglyceryl transferase family protein [Cyanobacteria bacterium J06627_28]
MTFPVYLPIGPLQLHPHFVFELLAYAVGLYFVLFRRLRRAASADTAAPTLLPSQRTSISVGALVGALLGAKVLVLLQHMNVLGEDWRQFALLVLQGKTIVGALLGGLIGVEVTKKQIGVTQSTGDSFVFSVMVGMMIGRMGCFLTGLSDRTYGIATTLPWGVDFGDGIARHPTQLYEIGFLAVLILLLRLYAHRSKQSGDLFKLFMIAYLGFRFAIDFIKPEFRPVFGLSAIQVACLGGLIYYRIDAVRLGKTVGSFLASKNVNK